MGHNNHSKSVDDTVTVWNNCPLIVEHVGINFMTQKVTITTIQNFSFKGL